MLLSHKNASAIGTISQNKKSCTTHFSTTSSNIVFANFESTPFNLEIFFCCSSEAPLVGLELAAEGPVPLVPGFVVGWKRKANGLY